MVVGLGRPPLLPAAGCSLRAAVPDSARGCAGAGHRLANGLDRKDACVAMAARRATIAGRPPPPPPHHTRRHTVTTAAGLQRCVAHVPLTCGYAAPLPAPSLCSRPRYPASPVPSGAPCHLVARATPRSAQNRGRVFLCSDPKRLSRFGHHEASCAPRRARIPTQRPVFGLETPPSYQRQAKKPDHMSGVHRCTVL